MNSRLWQTAVDRAGRLTAPLALDELPDADLLGRFTADRDEAAFAALVRRHGPLVWGVCRGLSPTEADAEDAFQATFLALCRSAARVRQATALGAWLHRVAGRVCRNGLRTRARRARHERAAAVSEVARPMSEAAWDLWQEAVHAEIDRLPDSLRVAFVLCVLQGVRQGEAARRLGWKLGTVSGRVCKAKQALAAAIERRGLTGAAGLAGVTGAGMLAAPLSAGLVARATMVIRPAVGPGSGISATVHELARGATGGVMSKTKLLAAAVLAGALTVASVGTQTGGVAEAQSAAAKAVDGDGPKTKGPRTGGSSGGAAKTPGPVGGMGMGGMGLLGSPKVEYRYQKAPDGTDKFKSLLTQLGNDGWEYVGPVPGAEELIFKRAQRAAMGGGMMAPGAGPGGGFGGMPSGLGGGGGFHGSGLGGGRPAPKAGGPPAPPPPPGGGLPPDVPGGLSGGGEGGGPGIGGMGRTADALDLRVGETIRHQKGIGTIDRVFVRDPKVAEVTLDPTDAKRVIIKSLTPGRTEVELTDAGGTTRTYTVRVR